MVNEVVKNIKTEMRYRNEGLSLEPFLGFYTPSFVNSNEKE